MISRGSININSWLMRQSGGFFDVFSNDIVAYHKAGVDAIDASALNFTYDTNAAIQSDSPFLFNLEYFMDYRNQVRDLDLIFSRDFSVDTDGVVSSQHTLTANETIDGESGWLKAVADTTATFKNIVFGNGRVNVPLYIELDVFLPVTNVDTITFDMRDNANEQQRWMKIAQATKGVRHKIRIYQHYESSSPIIMRTHLGNSQSTWLNTNGNELYIKNVKVYEVLNVLKLGQEVASVSPTFGGTTSNVYYSTDGISEIIRLDAIAPQLENITSFTIFGRFFDGRGAGVLNRLGGFGVNGTNYIQFYFDTANKLHVYTYAGGIKNRSTIATVARGGWANYIFVFDEGIPFVYVDGVHLPLNSTDVYNPSDWGATPTEFTLGAITLTTPQFDIISNDSIGVIKRAVKPDQIFLLEDEMNRVAGI